MSYNNEKSPARPVARELARELTLDEVLNVSGQCETSGGNAVDCTTAGPESTDRDVVQ